MTKLPIFLILFAISSSVMANPKYMRRGDLTAAVEPEDRILTAGIASSGVISKLSEQREAEARVASSLVAFKKSYADAHKLLEQARLSDVYDQDGFEVEQVPLDARLRSLEQAKEKESVDLLAIEKDEIDKSAAHQKVLLQGGMDSQLLGSKEQDDAANKRAATYSGTNAVVTGFWAKDRPFQERIDPDNMKIYTLKTYRHRFPFIHSWEVEVMWKKLPMAPRMVHKVHAQAPSATDTSVLLDSQMESGMTLVDENQRELVWTKDYNGYYHMGREAPTEADIYNIAHPADAQNEKFAKKEADQEELYGLYHDYSDDLQQVRHRIGSSKMIDREDAARQLQSMLADMQHTLKLQPSRSGKAFISVRGAEGDLCSFNADIAKVTGMAIKRRIEKATGIPWEAQMLFIKGKELDDTKLLNENVGAGNGAWIDLQQRGWEITQAALIKRGKSAQPMAPPQKTETVLAQAGIESHVAGNVAVGAMSPKPDEVREFASDAAEDKEVSAQQAADEVDDYNDADRGLTDDHDDGAKPDQMMDEKQKQKAAEEVYQVEAQKTSEEYSQKVDQKAQKDAEIATLVKPLVESAAQKDMVTREVVYVRGESGDWQVEKEEVATPTHPIPNQASFDNGADEGIPVQERISDANAKATPAEELLQGPTHHRFDKKAFMKEQKHALSEEMKWRSQEKLNDEKVLRDQATSTPPPRIVPEKASVGVLNEAESFLQIGSLSSPATPAAASLTASVAGDTKEMRDQALAEAMSARTLYVLDRKSKASLDIEDANAEGISQATQWREAANPMEKYEGTLDPMSMSEMSKRRTQQDKAYDGLQAVYSGFWPEDRPDERRVDITDYKIYTWRQYRLKYPFKHSWGVEEMWKQMPTEKRVKKLGKLAFVQRFR